MSYGNLHPQLVIPDRIFLAVYDKPDAAFAILPPDKFRIFLRHLVYHKIIDDPELAPIPVAAAAQDFIYHLWRNRNLSGIERLHPSLNLPLLLFHSRKIGQR